MRPHQARRETGLWGSSRSQTRVVWWAAPQDVALVALRRPEHPQSPPFTGDFMAKPPNYKQNKKRREDEQRKRNEEQQQRKAARKSAQNAPAAGDRTDPAAPPK